MTEPAPSRNLTLRLPNRTSAIAPAADRIAAFCRDHQVPEAAIGHLNLALDEAMTNTIEYGWPGGGEHEIAVSITVLPGTVEAEIADDGGAFDPLAVAAPDLDADLDSRAIGGLGIHFVRTLMDEVVYRREAGRNLLTLRKRFAALGSGEGDAGPRADTGLSALPDDGKEA